MQEYRKYVCSECEAIIYVKNIAYKKMIDIISNSGRKETGGILVGRYSSSLNEVYVNEMTNAPLDSTSGFSWFKRGVEGLRNYLINKWKRNEEFYLGEWHYHPANIPKPSRQDIIQLKQISKNEKFNCKEPIMMIVSKKENKYNVGITLLLEKMTYEFKQE